MANLSTIAVDVEKLKTISSETPSAKSVFKYLFERRRGRQDTNIKRVQRILKESGTEVTSDDISDVFKKLQDLGIGKIVFGRRGNPNRFMWTANLRSIKDILEGKSNELFKQKATVKKLDLPKLAAKGGEKPAPKPEAPEPMLPAAIESFHSNHAFIVRKGAVEITVPANLTLEEAKSVAALLSVAS